ncbi:non-muscle cofilin 1-like [Stegastes partitus]|uniref:Destrin n=1 Tax=Stegastes partitus TaxID=144197 RepID=A0A3B5A390_9TELE|nr:PREDICTED: destrin [Stegastes partitus]
MASGVIITDDVKNLYEAMKVVKAGDDLNSRVKVAILLIKDSKEIVVGDTYTHQDLEAKPGFTILTEQMDKMECFYALYDCSFETKDGVHKEDLVLLMWTSDGAHIKKKMLYASSKGNLKMALKGIKHDLQINDRSDWSKQAVAAKMSEKHSWVVAKIEGMDV